MQPMGLHTILRRPVIQAINSLYITHLLIGQRRHFVCHHLAFSQPSLALI